MIRRTGKTRAPLSPRAMGIYRRAVKGHRVHMRRLGEQAGRLREDYQTDHGRYHRDEHHFMRIQGLFDRRFRLSGIIKGCNRELLFDVQRRGKDKLDSELLALKLLAKANRSETLRRIGFLLIGRKERDPDLALLLMEQALFDNPLSEKNLYGIRIIASLCGIISVLNRDFKGLIRAWRYMLNAEAFHYYATDPELIEKDHWDSIREFGKEGRSDIIEYPHIQIGELATIFYDSLNYLYAKDFGFAEETIENGDVIVDSNILFYLSQPERNFPRFGRIRKAIKFCRHVIDQGGRLFITTPQYYEVGWIPDDLKPSIREVGLSESLEAYFYDTKKGRQATEKQKDQSEAKFGSAILGNLLKGIGGYGGVTDAIIISEAQLADTEPEVRNVPFLTLDDGILLPMAKSMGLTSVADISRQYGFSGFNFPALLGSNLRVLPIFPTTNIRYLYNNMNKNIAESSR